jgi:L-lysine 6-transaminase
MGIVEDEGLLDQVPAKGARLVNGLEGLVERYPALISNVRGLGLYQGFTVNDRVNKGRLIDLALDTEDLLLLGAGTDSIRFRPPLDVTEAEIDEMLARLERVLGRL